VRKRILTYFIVMLSAAIMAATVIMTLLTYSMFENRVIDDLSVDARVIAALLESEDAPGVIAQLHDALRVTIVDAQGAVLYVSGADLMNGTPILDIKPYLPFTDSHPEAVGGFADEKFDYALKVGIKPELLSALPIDKRDSLLELLAQDPRPSYQNDESRVYGFEYGNYEIKFTVSEGVLTVTEIIDNKATC